MPNGYSVGNLELDITALDKSATSLDTLVNRLRLVSKTITPTIQAVKSLRLNMSAISRLQFGSLDRFANGLNKISAINTQGLYAKLNSISRILTPLKELSQGITSLGAVNNFANGLQKIVKLDVAGFDTQIKSLTASLRPFLQEITVATPALTAFATAMASVKGRRMIGFKQFDQTGGGGKNLAKTLNLAGIIGKIYFIRNYTKQLGQFMSGLVQSAIDYTETLNLWQVAMRGNIDTAEEFITKMNKAYGIAEQTLMKYQATFRNMLSTLGGVSTDVSYALSEYLTQMALDYASLYNTSIEKAMTVFQSVLSGQVRPIRSISGYDITETTIFELYQQLGGTKTMRQLTQTEKRLLRIYAVFQQMDRSGAIGDLNKTLNNTANQIRIMSESAKELGVWLGKMIELYVAPALPYLNAFLITSKNIAQAIVKSLPNYSEFDGTIKGYKETAEAMDEVQGKLLDFDKFRSLSGGEEENNLGIDTNLIDGLSRYESILANVTNKATELAEKWTSFFVDSETGEITKEAKALYVVLLAMGGLAIFKSLSKKDNAFYLAFASKETGDSIAKIAQSMGGLSKSTQLLGGAIKFLTSPLGIILALVGVLYATNEDFRNSVNDLLKALSPLLTLALDLIGQVLEPIIPLIGGLLNIVGKVLAVGVKIITGIVYFAEVVIGLVLNPIELVIKAVGTLLTLLETLVTWRWGELGSKLSNLWGNWGTVDIMVGGAQGIGSTIRGYANGGMPEKGTMFVAGEAGAEMVYNTPSGQSGVANIQQIQQAMYGALMAYGQMNGGTDNRPIDIYIDGEKVFQATKKNAKRHGLAFSRV